MRRNSAVFRAALLAGCASFVGFGSAAQAAAILFASGATIGGQPLAPGSLAPGQQISSPNGMVQVQLDSGAIVSLVGQSSFAVNGDGSLQVSSGSVTVVNGPGGGAAVLHLAGGTDVSLLGAASFNVAAGAVDGHVLAGSATVSNPSGTGSYAPGQSFAVAGSDAPALIFTASPQAVPTPPANTAAPLVQNPAIPGVPTGTPQTIAEALSGPARNPGGALFGQTTQDQLANAGTTSPVTPPGAAGGSGAGALKTATAAIVDVIQSSKLNNLDTVLGYGPLALPFVIDDQGGLQSVTRQTNSTLVITRGTLVNSEVYADGTVAIGRWSGGTSAGDSIFALTANQGYYYALGMPAGTLPTTGTANYTLLSATSPTFDDGVTAPGHVTSASMAVLFGTAPKVGFQAALTMPEAGGTMHYAISTTGGVGDPASSDMFVFNDPQYNPNGSFEGGFTVTAGSTANLACTGSTTCNGFANGMLAGSGLGRAVVDYSFGGETRSVLGALALTATDTTPSPPPPPTPTPDPTPTPTPSATPTGSYLFLLNGPQGNNTFQADSAKAAIALGGVITAFDAGITGAHGTASTVDAGTATTGTSTVSWTRWAGGTPTGTAQNFQAVSADQGYVLLAGTPLSHLPTTGTAQYTLLGGTKPVMSDGSLAPGTFTGAMAIDFAARKLGLDANVAIGTANYVLQSTGGTATPASSEIGYSAAGQINGTIAVPAAGVCTSACAATVFGSLYGNAAQQAGITYNINSFGPTNVFGVAAFGKN